MAKYSVLVVDDFSENLSSTKDLLHRWGYAVDTATSGDEAIEQIKSGFKDYAVVILDYQMPGKSGTVAAEAIRAINQEVVLLIYSAYPSIESLRATIRAGALNFIDKNEEVTSLKDSLTKACVEYEKVRKVKPPISPSEATQLIASINMVGRSEKLAQVATQVQLSRTSKKPVLILGETGVGKELVAAAIHGKNNLPYFVVNCASLRGSSLVESELFGHEKGAFTGAMTRKIGILEMARGGTVYLDELHHLDAATQGKLLRVLREKKIRRVGAAKEESVDFRLIASSWPDIEERVADGSLLPDLYYRLKYLTIEIPPLRERPEDIEPLVAHLCEKHFKETGIRKHFLQKTIRYLENYPWKGNVGELDGYVSELLTKCTKDTIDESLLDARFLGDSPSSTHMTFSQLEARQLQEKKAFIQTTLRSSKSIIRAAQKMGIKETSLHTLMTRLGIRQEMK